MSPPAPGGAARHAVYFVPGDGTPLARFGHGVLGRDALAAPTPPLPGLPSAPEAWTARPARYGFHATLKAPFRLAADVDEAGLAAACDALARSHAPIPLAGLAPALLGRFAALVLPGPVEALDRLAADCVIGLEPFRAPLDAAALARRRPASLDPAARERLERWGYPHVLEGFRFHMTLSAPLPDAGDASLPSAVAGADGAGKEDGSGEAGERLRVEAWLEALRGRFAATVGATPALDRLALCREAAPDAPFVRVAEFPLGGGEAPASAPR